MAESNNIRMNIGAISIVTLLVLQLIAFSFGYGTLTQQVAYNKQLIRDYIDMQKTVGDKLDDFSTRLTKIETILRNQ